MDENYEISEYDPHTMWMALPECAKRGCKVSTGHDARTMVRWWQHGEGEAHLEVPDLEIVSGYVTLLTRVKDWTEAVHRYDDGLGD